jgi:hypothetical protein
MKKIIFLLSFFITTLSFAQNNLQFSKAILIKINGTRILTSQSAAAMFVFKDTTITVPAGKVWKVESANVTLQNTNPAPNVSQIEDQLSNSYMGTYLLLDNKIISQKSNTIITAGGIYQANLGFSFPIWLPTGTYPIRLLFQCGTYTFGAYTSSITGYGGMSILEFNIVQ